MKTSITSILDIDSNELPQKLIDLLKECETFEDKKHNQHIYNPNDFLQDEEDFPGVHDFENIELLREIDGLLIANGCEYFRITI